MHTTTNPADLAPLTELANAQLQEYLRTLPDFATSSRWSASAIVLRKDEGPEGYQLQIGFELNTPLVESLQDTITSMAASKEAAVQQIVAEWIDGFLQPALAMHSETAGDQGETRVSAQNRIYFWRLGSGPLLVASEDKGVTGQLQKDLEASPLFTRLNLAAILPIQQEVPMLALKLQIIRPPAFIDPAQTPVYECKINNKDWPQGLGMLKQFHLPPGSAAVRIAQGLFFRRGPKPNSPAAARVAATSTTAPASASRQPASAPPSAPAARRPWWKVW